MATSLRNWGFAGSVGTVANPAANAARIANAGLIHEPIFKAVIGVFFAIAALSLAARTIVRMRARGRLSLDDAFLTFAFLCLAAAGGVAYYFADFFFEAEALQYDPAFVISFSDIMRLRLSLEVIEIFLALIWTCIFAVKATFLSLFYRLIGRVSRALRIWYWIVVTTCFLSWAALTFEILAVCPHLGSVDLSCPLVNRSMLDLLLVLTGSILDIGTDIMVISIPIMLLRKTRLKSSQKIGVLAALCLSVVMIMIAIIRYGPYRYQKPSDATWTFFWQYIEACVAVVMGAVPAFRGFSNVHHRCSDRRWLVSPLSMRAPTAWRRRSPSFISTDDEDDDNTSEDTEAAWPAKPGKTYRGLHSVYRHDDGASTGTKTTLHSCIEPCVDDVPPLPLADNEIFIKKHFNVSSNRATPEIPDD